jgi:hypothetical protein
MSALVAWLSLCIACAIGILTELKEDGRERALVKRNLLVDATETTTVEDLLIVSDATVSQISTSAL